MVKQAVQPEQEVNLLFRETSLEIIMETDNALTELQAAERNINYPEYFIPY